MTRVAVISANLGSFDPPAEYVAQKLAPEVELGVFRFTDENFPPRSRAMTPRLQARIPKMFGWEMVPGFEYYIWLDASLSMLHAETVMWFLERCKGSHQIAVFRHPDRRSIYEEYLYIKKRIEDGNKYLASRYAGELLEEQIRAVSVNRDYIDNKLYATTAFIYKNCSRVRLALREWWVHTSRYHIVDQLALPYVLYESECDVNEMPENLYKIPYITYTRNWKDDERIALFNLRDQQRLSVPEHSPEVPDRSPRKI